MFQISVQHCRPTAQVTRFTPVHAKGDLWVISAQRGSVVGHRVVNDLLATLHEWTLGLTLSFE